MAEAMWIRPGEDEANLLADKPARCPTDEGFLSDSRLCALVWIGVLHMAKIAASLQKLAVTTAFEGGDDAAGAMAALLQKDESLFKQALSQYQAELGALWGEPDVSPAKPDPALQGWQLEAGLDSLACLCARLLPWGIICLPAMTQAVVAAAGGAGASMGGSPEAILAAKSAVKTVSRDAGHESGIRQTGGILLCCMVEERGRLLEGDWA